MNELTELLKVLDGSANAGLFVVALLWGLTKYLDRNFYDVKFTELNESIKNGFEQGSQRFQRLEDRVHNLETKRHD